MNLAHWLLLLLMEAHKQGWLHTKVQGPDTNLQDFSLQPHQVWNKFSWVLDKFLTTPRCWRQRPA